MNLYEIESRLRVYEAVGEKAAAAHSFNILNDEGEILVKVNGRLEEVDIKKELEWIPQALKFLERRSDFLIDQWNMLAKTPSGKEYQRLYHETKEFIDELEKYREVFLAMKHSNRGRGNPPDKGGVTGTKAAKEETWIETFRHEDIKAEKAEQDKDTLLRVTQDKVLSLKKRLRVGQIPSKEELQRVADETRGRRQNRKTGQLRKVKQENNRLNYSAIGRYYGICHHTAKDWCNKRGVV